MAPSTLTEGDLVDLCVTWGRQSRLKCIVCTRYLSNRSDKGVSCRCGTSYAPSTLSGQFLIERLP